MDSENRIKPQTQDVVQHPQTTACDSMPDFTRLRYFYGQMLAAQDLQTEQDYFREKLKLLNRCLEGYGTVCGLKVVAASHNSDYEKSAHVDVYEEAEQAMPVEANGEARQRYPQPSRAWVEVECGMALDCAGNELIVRQPIRVDLWQALTDAERRQVEDEQDGRARLYLSLCYCVQAIDPVRPVLPDACNAISECVYSKLRDSVKVKVTLTRPRGNHCRDNCCEKCQDKCLLLAVVEYNRGQPPVIYNDVRRWIGVYEPVKITGVNWVHAAENYTPEEAVRLLQEQGLTIEFSRPIIPETVTKGVVDVVVFEGGKGRHGGMYYIDGDISIPDNRHIVFKDPSEEMLEHDDRVMVIVRTDFILDECCRPVDGNHTGGRIPLLENFSDNKPQHGTPPVPASCAQPPRRYGAWTSGNGTPGGTFESWFYIRRPPRAPRQYENPAPNEMHD